ncbi:MAG: hypothetical protein JSS43_00885 [Proteobacteria bacterium]|nr:hypothetical protein [Pseudomonadota bacterium]
MNIPVVLPDWVPWWVPIVLLVPALLYALAFLFMPFSVLGLKSRLEVLEARLDEIQNEIRMLSLRLPAGPREVDFDDVYAPISSVTPRRAEPAEDRTPLPERPPIPPAARDLYDEDGPVEREPPPPHMRPVRRLDAPPVVRADRVEPRLDRRR